MNYIINPSWFYWLHVVENLKAIGIIALVFLSAGLVVALILGAIFYSDGCFERGDDPDWLMYLNIKKIILKAILPPIVVLVLVGIFMPDRQALIEMQIAKFATYGNAEWTIDTVKAAVDYIVESIQSIK